MSIQSGSRPEVERLAHLERQLSEARERARSYDYDEPDEAAIERSRDLLANIAHSFDDLTPFQVSVGIDGAIEISASSARASVEIEVSQDGSRMEAVAGEHGRATSWSCSEPTWRQLLSEIMKAA